MYECETETVKKVVARNLRLLRADKNLTLARASRLADIHWRHWQRLESARANATLHTLVSVAGALRVDLPALVSSTATPADQRVEAVNRDLRRELERARGENRRLVEVINDLNRRLQTAGKQVGGAP